MAALQICRGFQHGTAATAQRQRRRSTRSHPHGQNLWEVRQNGPPISLGRIPVKRTAHTRPGVWGVATVRHPALGAPSHLAMRPTLKGILWMGSPCSPRNRGCSF